MFSLLPTPLQPPCPECCLVWLRQVLGLLNFGWSACDPHSPCPARPLYAALIIAQLNPGQQLQGGPLPGLIGGPLPGLAGLLPGLTGPLPGIQGPLPGMQGPLPGLPGLPMLGLPGPESWVGLQPQGMGQLQPLNGLSLGSSKGSGG